MDLVVGVTTAADHGVEEVDGRRWRHLKATANLAETSSRRSDGMPSPARGRYEELLAHPIEVWLDGSHLRRIRFVEDHRTESLLLVEPGVDTDGLDWSQLPDFR